MPCRLRSPAAHAVHVETRHRNGNKNFLHMAKMLYFGCFRCINDYPYLQVMVNTYAQGVIAMK